MSIRPCLAERAITRPIVTRKMTAARDAAEVRPEIATTSLEVPRISRSTAAAGTGTWARQGTLRLRARTGGDPLLAISRGRAHAVEMLGADLNAMMRTG
jgi:hypothetical protein